MFKTIAAIATAVVVLTGASAAMAETKTKRPTVCAEQFTTAKTAEGKEIGVCTSAKGRHTYLSSFQIVEVKDADGSTHKVMVGFR